MTPEDIMRMARTARIKPQGNSYAAMLDELTHFAALIAAAEREECIKAIIELDDYVSNTYPECIAAIRARGQQ